MNKKRQTVTVLNEFEIPDGGHHLFQIKLDQKCITKNLKPIFIYNFCIKNTKTDEYELNCKIPYYLSDAHTNHFRSNTLFPFICLNDKETQDVSCPKNTEYPNGLLFKYQIKNNTCTHLIHNRIIKKLNIAHKNLYKKIISTKIVSYLPRVTNFLDFMIGILLNPKIANINNRSDEKEFMPFYSKNLNDIFINNNPTLKNTTYESELSRLPIRHGFNGNRTSQYRKYLMDELKSYTKEFSIILQNINTDFKNVKYTKVNLNHLNICDNTHINPNICKDGKVNIQAYLNFENYREFSVRFYALMKSVINRTSDENPTLNLNLISTLLQDNKCNYKPEPRSLPDHIRNWNAACVTNKQQHYLIHNNRDNINRKLKSDIKKLNESIKKFKLYSAKITSNMAKANNYLEDLKRNYAKKTSDITKANAHLDFLKRNNSINEKRIRRTTEQLNKFVRIQRDINNKIKTTKENRNEFFRKQQDLNKQIQYTTFILKETKRELNIINNLPLLFEKYNNLNKLRNLTSEDKERLEKFYTEQNWYKFNQLYEKLIKKPKVSKKRKINKPKPLLMKKKKNY